MLKEELMKNKANQLMNKQFRIFLKVLVATLHDNNVKELTD